MSTQVVKPISPKEMKKLKLASIPNEIIEAVNELIQKNFTGSSSVVKQDELMIHIFSKLKDGQTYMGTKITRGNINDLHLLDFEELYIQAGWEVEYESPDRDESFDSYFKFTIK